MAAIAAVLSIFAISNAVTYGNDEARVSACACTGCGEMTECTNCEECEGCKGEGCSDCGTACDMTMSEFKKEPMKHSSGMTNAMTDDTCPVSGEPLGDNPKTVKYLGKEYKFCCPGCVAEFKAEPMDYVKEELKCPVEGGAGVKEISAMYEGTKYYFCCAGCDKEFLSNPDKYMNGNSSEK